MTSASAASDQHLGRTDEEIQGWLVARFAELGHVDRDDIDIDRPFSDLSLDSSVAVSITAEFSGWIGFELNATLFWEYPTIRRLAQALSA